MGILTLLFLLPTLAFSLGEVARIQLQGTVAFTLLDGIAVLLSLCGFFFAVKKRQSQYRLLLPLLFFVGICFLSLLLNPLHLSGQEMVVSFLYLLRWIIYAGVYLFVRNVPNGIKKKIPVWMVISGSSILVLGFIQYIYYPNLRYLFYLGWDEHLYRLFSTFLDPNFAGMFFVLFILLLLPFVEKSWRAKERNKMLTYGSLSLFSVLAILLTYSRTAFIMLIAGLLVYLLLHRKVKILLVAIIAFILLIVATSNFKVEGMNPLRTASSAARVESMQDALSIIEKYPLLGVGFNSYQYALYHYGFRNTQSPIPSHAVGGTDNSFLFVAATTGIVGLGIFLYLLGRILYLGYKQYQKRVFLADTAISSVIALSIGSLFINGLFYPMMLFWIFTLLGVSEE